MFPESRQLTRLQAGACGSTRGYEVPSLGFAQCFRKGQCQETATRVAVGGLVMEFWKLFGIRVLSHVVSIGGIKWRPPSNLRDRDLDHPIPVFAQTGRPARK